MVTMHDFFMHCVHSIPANAGMQQEMVMFFSGKKILN